MGFLFVWGLTLLGLIGVGVMISAPPPMVMLTVVLLDILLIGILILTLGNSSW